ncbi:MAG: PTS glucose transporter subunit IIA [Eubacteriales bacterium]|nr:PTS glucose transporter subunit IIA [Eubacteriales bacterium]
MQNPSAYELVSAEEAEPAPAEGAVKTVNVTAALHELYAAGNGKVVKVEDVPDDVFASKALGDGVAVILEDGKVYAPADGEISMVADTLHAYGITTPDGLELLVHIGVNTVELKGQGFQPKVSVGQTVQAGDLLCEVDMKLMKSKGYPMHTPTLLTNGDECGEITLLPCDKAKAGKTVVVQYRL